MQFRGWQMVLALRLAGKVAEPHPVLCLCQLLPTKTFQHSRVQNWRGSKHPDTPAPRPRSRQSTTHAHRPGRPHPCQSGPCETDRSRAANHGKPECHAHQPPPSRQGPPQSPQPTASHGSAHTRSRQACRAERRASDPRTPANHRHAKGPQHAPPYSPAWEVARTKAQRR